jgi:hypothetical protein
LWLVLLVVLLAQPWRTMMVASDGDPCYHRRLGETMLQQHRILRTEMFSHTRQGRPLIAPSWLSDILFAAAGRCAGFYGIAVVAAVLIATTFALLHHQLVREGNSVAVATVLVLLAVWASCVHWLARPLLFTVLFALLTNETLRRFEIESCARQAGAKLGVLMVLWVNLHAGFVLGFAVLGAYWLGALIDMLRSCDRARARQRLRALTAIGLCCAAVSLLNPYGYHLHLSVWHFLRSQYLRNWFAEYSSTEFASPTARGFLVWLALMFLVLAVLRPRVSCASGILLASWTYNALYAVRNIPAMTVLTAPVLAPALSDSVRNRWPDTSQWLDDFSARCRGWPLVAVAALGIVLTPRPTEIPANTWPVTAVQYVQDHPQQFAGNMFNQFVWGGYLLWELPDHKVFIDGRADFYGEALIREFSNTAALGTNWPATLAKYDVSWTLMPTEHRLNLALALLPGWHCAYSDEVAMVYSRVE